MKGDHIMKTPEELKALKEEVETLNKKLAELTKEELSQILGGTGGRRDCETMCECPCGNIEYKEGYHINELFYCSKCKQYTLKGISLHRP